jgi:prolyl-tRNA editing enzyme YbaK/EbsC (Cys-tRNA(Pro) deacylase)
MEATEEAADRFDVIGALEAAGVPHRIRAHGAAAYTSEAAARERDVRLSQIAKVILLRPRAASDEIIVAVLPGDRRIDWAKLKSMLDGRGVTFLERESILERLGLVPGAISPLHPKLAAHRMIIDQALLNERDIDLSTGSLEAGVEIESVALIALLPSADVADVSAPGES